MIAEIYNLLSINFNIILIILNKSIFWLQYASDGGLGSIFSFRRVNFGRLWCQQE